jgi:hypothetical protein
LALVKKTKPPVLVLVGCVSLIAIGAGVFVSDKGFLWHKAKQSGIDRPDFEVLEKDVKLPS